MERRIEKMIDVLKKKIKLLEALINNELDEDLILLYKRELQKAKEEISLIEQCPSDLKPFIRFITRIFTLTKTFLVFLIWSGSENKRR